MRKSLKNFYEYEYGKLTKVLTSFYREKFQKIFQTKMDIENLLNLERRTGINNDDIEDFARKADDVQRAIEGMMRGELRPEDIKIAGIESEEEKSQKEEEKRKRLAIQKQKDDELRLLRKNEERERWWLGADLFVENMNSEKSSDIVDNDGNIVDINEKIKARYTADYSRWNEWKPNDPVTLLEEEEKVKLEDDTRNKEFEKNNPDFCNQYLNDMKKRSEDMTVKRESAVSARLKGNNYFKKKLYEDALSYYVESLKLAPYDVKTLTNLAQVYIQKKEYDDALEFLSRTLHLDNKHIKALSRKAHVLSEQYKPHQALEVIHTALKLSPSNEELLTQKHELEIIIKDIEIENNLKKESHTNAVLQDGIIAIDNLSIYFDELINEKSNTLYDSEIVVQKLKDSLNLMTDVNVRCYARISGLLLKSIIFLNQLHEQHQSNDFIRNDIFVHLFNFLTAAVDSQRAAHLFLSKNKFVVILKNLLGTDIAKDRKYLEAIKCLTDFMKLVCTENICSPLRDNILSDKFIIARIAILIGELSSSHISDNDAISCNISCNVISNLSLIVYEATICDKKKSIFGNDMCFIVCAIGSALNYWLHRKTPIKKNVFVEYLIHALIGLSQYESLRSSYSIPFLPDDDYFNCINTLLEYARLNVDIESKVYAILMNITLDSNNYDVSIVKATVISSYFDELMGIVLMSDAARSSCPDKFIISRGTGLLSRIISEEDAQVKILNNVSTMYYGFCRNLKRLDKDILENWESDEQLNLIKILASINPSNACKNIVLTENILGCMLNMFPMPKLELNEITRNSVILPTSKVFSAVLLGNVCKILINYADDSVLYANNIMSVEKLICCFANVHDIRVRKNIAIILAKGSKLFPSVKQKVQDLRGMEMLTELSDKL